MLVADGIVKEYANGVRALDRISLDVGRGEFLVIVGRSGCGKSSFLRLIAGLEARSSGRLVIDGQTETAPRASVGVVFQEPRLLPWLRVGKNVGFGLQDLPADERTRRIETSLSKVGLSGFAHRWPHELSGGQAQRVAIARALAPAPQLILLDEPFSALDTFTRQELQRYLISLWRELGLTVLLATHDIDEAVLLADRVIVMSPGRISGIHRLDLSRPRDPLERRFQDCKAAVLASLGETV